MTDTPEDAEYRARARAWLAEHAAQYRGAPDLDDDAMVGHSKAYTRAKWDAGYSGIDVPKTAGGAGGTARQARIFDEEEAAYNVPRTTASHLALAGLMKHGTPEQIARWGKVHWSGEGRWTQLFSEPSAGSDLAGLRTRAVRQGDKWIINGQKVWSSWAQWSDFGFLIARTDGSVPKHKGLSFFFIDMRQPGIEVRPIRQMTGAADFNEVFFTDAVVPHADMIGPEGKGWEVAMTVLSAERAGAGTAGSGEGRMSPVATPNLLRVAQGARREGGKTALDSAEVRRKIAHWYAEEQGVKHFARRIAEMVAAGAMPPASMPGMKIVSASRNQQAYAWLMDMEEYSGIVQDADWPEEDKYYAYLYAPIWRIAGGSDEILRNQISERALGMPSDIRLDKDVPFDQLPF